MVNYYSDISSSEFENNTCGKKEFTKYSLASTSNSKNSLKPHQQWIANYINPKTPFKGLLVYHETGTGKTCTAISVAENFREELAKKHKKIFILSSENIKEEFYRTISNPGNSFKCTGDTYHDMLRNSQINQKNINSKINEFYNFMTHYTFGSKLLDKIEQMVKNKSSDEEIIKYIKKEYSGSVIIIDEAQHLRAKFDSNDKKKSGEKPIHDAIDLISKHADDVKMLFLTATPMYDNPTEIIWIINVLIRLNEKNNIEELDINDIFMNENNGYKFTENGEEKFIDAIKGKVTFLRNGNPTNFPLSLVDPDAMSEKPKTIVNDFNGNKLNDSHIPMLTISEMSESHYKIIEKLQNDNEKMDSFHMQSMQMHNVSWHTKIDDKSPDSGGIKKYFKITQSDGSPKIYSPINKNFFDNLNEYAPKIQTIVNNILEMDSGIAFIFSQFISSGVIPMILALEANGFSKYDGKASDIKHLDKTNVRDKGRYLVITSDKELSGTKKQQLEWINIARSKGNEYGNNIRVIIASGSGGEGIDLKWIRQVHIMEPHFHFSQIEQAVGRAIRNNSHIELEKEKRNCTIFYHSVIYPKRVNKESVDMYLYRIAMRKRKATNNVRKIIQENSITCNFFKKLNNFDYKSYENSIIIDSKGKKHKFSENMIFDDSYSNICNTCINNYESDSNTYDPKIHSKWQLFESMKVIQKLFKVHNVYSLEDIIISVNKFNSQIDKETIYFALDILINNPIKVFENEMGVMGKVSFDGKLYYFKPDYYEYSQINSIPDVSPLVLANSVVNLDTIPWVERQIIANSEIEEQFREILNKPNIDKDEFWSNIEEKDDLIANIMIDRLSSEERENLLKKNSLTINSLIKSLNRYVLEDGFMDIKSIKVPYQIKNINIEGSNNISKPYASGKRNVFAYIDIIKGVGTLYLTDTTQGKASGRRILPSEKSRIIKYINTLFTLKDDNRKPLLEYDRYVDAPAKAGQLNSKLKLNKNLMNPNGIKADDLIVECEMLFRLLEKRRPNGSKKWFYDSWEALENKIPSKDKKS